MAGPIAHIFLALQALAGPLAGLFNEKEFVIGNSLPDIQYLKVVSRDETHFTNVSFQDIVKEKDPIKAGMLFHSFVDEQREAFVVKHKFYDEIGLFRFSTQSLKLAEDQILRSFIDSKKYQAYFDDILDKEKHYGIDEIHLKKWHSFLQNYIAQKDSINDIVMLYFNIHEPNAWFIKRWLFSWFYGTQIEYAVSRVLNNERLKNLILDFYMNFNNTIQNNQ